MSKVKTRVVKTGKLTVEFQEAQACTIMKFWLHHTRIASVRQLLISGYIGLAIGNKGPVP